MLVCLKAGMKAAVPAAPTIATAQPERCIATNSSTNRLRHTTNPDVSKPANRLRQKMISHAVAATPLANSPAELHITAESTRRRMPICTGFKTLSNPIDNLSWYSAITGVRQNLSAAAAAAAAMAAAAATAATAWVSAIARVSGFP